MKKVGVEKGLSDVKEYLTDNGYSVEEFERNSINNANFYNTLDAIIITGQSMNLMGIEDTKTEVPEVMADGLTPEEVKRQLENKVIGK